MIMIVSLAIKNNSVYVWGYSSWSMIMIVSWAIDFVYLRAILTGSVIVIISGLLRIT